METRQTKQKSAGRRAALVLAALLLLALLLCALTMTRVYPAMPEALQVLERPADGVTVRRSAERIDFIPAHPQAGLVFYPGAMVQFEAYAPLMERLAGRGVLCVLLRMPGNLAVLNPDAADGVQADYPEITRWFLGGHSLGGAVAANYASDHGEKLRGLVLLASYATHPLDPGLQVLLVVGSEDGVVNRAKLEAGMQYLPADAVFYTIPGGNHAQFGSYGPQRGDGEARIAPEEQWAETAAVLARLPDRAA